MNFLLVGDRLDVVPEELLRRTVVSERREDVAKRRFGRELRERFGLMRPAFLGEHLSSDLDVEAQVRIQCEQTFGGLGQSLDLLRVELASVLRKDGARAEKRHRKVHAPIADILRGNVLVDEAGRNVPVLPLAVVHPCTPRGCEPNEVAVCLDLAERAPIGHAVFDRFDVSADEVRTLEHVVPRQSL